ncbi:MAG: FAD-binding oxidoreductase [Candidatus Poribacteria bacterium]|nr:FAD-binding oxidoreductase [Candidatus Poribacteria bacterium]
MSIPSNASYVIIGAGVHGLSTAYHLALELKSRGHDVDGSVVVVEKTAIAAGASGIACGVIRNNYYQPAMRELMAHSVAVWNSDPETYSYHPVGYLQISPAVMEEQVAGIYEEQCAIGYESSFIHGAGDCAKYMDELFGDWQAEGTTSILHEKSGGYANNKASMQGLAGKARAQGVRILEGVCVTGFERDSAGAVTSVVTDQGTIECGYVIVGAGPWIKSIWEMLELPKSIDVKGPEGEVVTDFPMWKFWCLQEGTLGVDPNLQRTRSGDLAPVIHVDSDAPLFSDIDGSLITEEMWGIYYKPDFNFGGVQGGAAPCRVETDPDKVEVDPYGPESPDYVVNEDFALMWVSCLAHCQKRFKGTFAKYRNERSGGLGAFTPDNFPVFDVFCDNCYVIADSNHGYKMIGVGKLVAREIMGETSALLEPFRFSRYAEGALHPTSNSPFPWS